MEGTGRAESGTEAESDAGCQSQVYTCLFSYSKRAEPAP